MICDGEDILVGGKVEELEPVDGGVCGTESEMKKVICGAVELEDFALGRAFEL